VGHSHEAGALLSTGHNFQMKREENLKSHFAWKQLGRSLLPGSMPVVTRVNHHTGHQLKLYSENQTVDESLPLNDELGVEGWEKLFSRTADESAV